MSDTKNHSTTHEKSDSPSGERIVDVKVVKGNVQFAELVLREPPRPWAPNMLKLYLCCLFGFFCSTMNGYDGSLMGTMLALPSFKSTFGAEIIGFKASYISAMYQIGGVVALPFVGPAVDTWGRRAGMAIGCIIIIIGTVIQGTTSYTTNLSQFLAGRFLLGGGISIAASAGPAYVVELAHPAYRGILTGLYNCCWFSGSILAAGSLRGSVHTGGNMPWVLPTYFQMVFPGIVLVASFFLPESPRWLYCHGKTEECKKVLTKYHANGNPDSEYIDFQIREFEEAMDLDGADKRWWDYSALFRDGPSRYRLMCNIIVSIAGQWAGNGVVSYFLPGLLSTAGITAEIEILNINLGLAFVQATFASIGATQVERIGRRGLLLFTNIALSFIWVAITAATAAEANSPTDSAAKAAVAFIFIFGIFYSFGFTPLQALYPVEVLSFEQRAKGMAFSSLAVNAANLLNQFAWPNALAKIAWKTYIIFVVWTAFQALVIYWLVVETKGRTLEELDEIFKSENPRKESTKKKKIAVDASAHVVKVEEA